METNHEGVKLIAQEVDRAARIEFHTPESDDGYENAELLDAASAYLQYAIWQIRKHWRNRTEPDVGATSWPWRSQEFKPHTNPIRNLMKAGGLIASEIVRIKRREKATVANQDAPKPAMATEPVSREIPSGETFQAKLKDFLNRNSVDADCDTADFIIAEYVKTCLDGFRTGVLAREKWYGRGEKPKPQINSQRLGGILGDWYESAPYGEQIPEDFPKVLAAFMAANGVEIDEEKALSIIADAQFDDPWTNLFEAIFSEGARFAALKGNLDHQR